MIDHKKEKVIDALGVIPNDIREFIGEFSSNVVEKGSISRAIEEILIKLNNLKGEEKTKYWNVMLFFMYQGIGKITTDITESIFSNIGDFISELKKTD